MEEEEEEDAVDPVVIEDQYIMGNLGGGGVEGGAADRPADVIVKHVKDLKGFNFII